MQRWNDKAMEIEGKWYVESGNEIVEVQPKTVEVKIGGEVVSFVENSTYENYYGFCHVWSLKDNGTMDVEYIRTKVPGVAIGQKNTYPIKAQAETIFNERRREEVKLSRLNITAFAESDMFTLGYLASHGTISVQVTEKAKKRFAENYRALTGEEAFVKREGAAYITEDDHYWNWALAITCRLPKKIEALRLPEGTIVRGNSASIWNSKFVWGLFKMGMKIGQNGSQAEAMASQLTGAAAEKFLEGVAAGRNEVEVEEVVAMAA